MSPERKRKRGGDGTPLPTHLDNQEGYDPFTWRGISDLKGARDREDERPEEEECLRLQVSCLTIGL